MRNIEQYLIQLKEVLNGFIDFLKDFPDTTEQQKKNLAGIKEFNLLSGDKKGWVASFSIFDREIQEQKVSKTGTYCRSWTINYEDRKLEIEAETKTYPDDITTDDFTFFWHYYYKGDEIFSAGSDFAAWLNDARNYKKYITQDLNDIEIDIEFY